MKASHRHYWILAGIGGLGVGLRFWQLDLKPLWMDEVITALFSLGHTYDEVPLNQAVPLSAFEQLFQLNSSTSCPQIVTTVTTQSVHPPLFFCWMHSWLTWVHGWSASWVWKLRALPALAGVGAIGATYLLNRALFFPRAGLMGAALMAVSPFAVYLSQEARHYTVPIVFVILALLALHHLLLDLQSHSFRPALWLAWIAVNSLGFYVHYFFLLAFVAQAVVLGLATWRSMPKRPYHPSAHPPISPSPAPLLPLLAITAVCLTYLPWLPTFLTHMTRPETDWLNPQSPSWQHAIAPLYQIPLTWVLMVIALPLEQQPWWIALLSILGMVVFGLWLSRRVIQGVQRLLKVPETLLGTWMLLGFMAVVLLEFLAIAYFLGKDLTAIPRYSFIYFPAVIALIGASLMEPVERGSQQAGVRSQNGHSSLVIRHLTHRMLNREAIWVVVAAGIVSSLCVTHNLVFQKPYNPERIAQNIRSVDPHWPTLVTMAYSGNQDVAMGLSFALGLQQETQGAAPSMPPIYFALMLQNQGYNIVWSDLSRLKQPLTFPLNLWAISPGLKRTAFPAQLLLQDQAGNSHPCSIDPKNHHRMGIPYQRYRCG
jgi:uncharacterized membrane protein